MIRLAATIALALLLGLAAAPARADIAAAIAAYEHGEFATAFRLFEIQAERGSIEAEWRLGVMYEHGRGVASDFRLAAERYQRAADQGHPEARADLAALLFHGHGVPRDVTEAVRLTGLAADQGVARAQYKMGLVYQYGQRVDEDYGEAYFWLALAAAAGHAEAAASRDALVTYLSADMRAEAERRVAVWQPVESADAALGVAPLFDGERVSGTGFVVTTAGHVLTNAHVVLGCPGAVLGGQDGGSVLEVLALDRTNDLALLQLAQPRDAVATFAPSETVRPGDPVVVVGFPLRGILASEANVTTGIVSALAGPDNDRRLIQITAPVQRGNSGGPVFDGAGRVIGVVVSKLDAMKIARATGDIPQNVNFGIRTSVAAAFLASQGISPLTAGSTTPLTPAETAQRAMAFTLPLECWR
jgi:uncharacterized protein